MSKKTEERIAALQRLATNKACFDCRRPGLQSSVCFPFGIFVCTSCAGLHRQFPDHHVNTINMTTFSEKQADLLESNGNRKAASIFLAYHNDPATLPNETSPQATITAFIRDCFVHRRWVVAPNQPATKAAATPSSAPANHSATISPAGAIPGRRGAVEAPHAPAGVIPAMSTANARRGSALSPATSIPAASAAPTSAGRRNTVTASAAPNRTVGGGHPAPDFFAAGPAAGGSSLAGGSGTVDVFAAAPQQAAPAAAAAAPAAPADVSSIRFFADVQFPYGVSPSSLDSNLSTASKELAKAMASIILNHRLNASQFATVVGTATMVTARARAAREPTDPALMNQQQNQQRRSSVSAAASPIAPIPAPMGGPMQRPSAPAPTSMPVQAPTRGQADAFGGGADPFGPASVGEEADDDDVFGAPKVPPTRPAAAGPIEGRPMTVPAPVAAAAAPANDDFAADFGAQSSSLAAPAPVPAAIAQADPFADVAPPATTGRLSLGGGTAPGPAAGTTMYDLLQGNTAPAASLRRQPGGPGAGPVPTPYGAPYGAGVPGAGYGAAPGASLTMTGQYGGYAMQQQQQQQQQQQAQQYGYPPQQQPQQQYGMGGYPQQQQQQQPYGYPQQAPYGAPGGYNQQMPGNYMGGYPQQQQQFQQPMQQSSQMQTLQPKKTAEQEAADKAFSDIAMPF